MTNAWSTKCLELAKTSLPVHQNTSIKIKIADPFSISNPLVKRSKRVTRETTTLLATLKNSVANYGTIASWYEKDVRRYRLFIETRYILNAVMIVAVILASITLSSTLSMRVLDLQTDIAILKALGAHPKRLEYRLFLYGLINGIISALLGIVGGITLNALSNILIESADAVVNAIRYALGQSDPVHLLNTEYYLTLIPFHIYWGDLFPIALLAITLSVCATYLPVRKIRYIPALKIIRHH